MPGYFVVEVVVVAVLLMNFLLGAMRDPEGGWGSFELPGKTTKNSNVLKTLVWSAAHSGILQLGFGACVPVKRLLPGENVCVFKTRTDPINMIHLRLKVL
jgi:hypothetical protein